MSGADRNIEEPRGRRGEGRGRRGEGRGRHGEGARLLAGATATFALVLALVAMALASGGGTVSQSSNARLGSIVVDAHGRTLYALSPETTRHLLCKSSVCLKLWHPLTVSSAKAKLKLGAGVHGRLRLLHRSNGMLQVTLNGQPLYRYSGDLAKGQTNGQGIHSFGGRWHVLAAASGPGKSGSGMTSTTSTTGTVSRISTTSASTTESYSYGY